MSINYKLNFKPKAHKDFVYFSGHNKEVARKILELIDDIQKHPYSGIGKPEALKHNLSGWWSRRIDQKNRLVYKIEVDKIIISSCRFHYTK